MIDQEAVLRRYAQAAEDAHAELTELDQHSGDGDFGDNLRGGLREAVARFEAGAGTPFGALGAAFLDEVGGTSGPLLGLLFTEIAHALDGSGEATAFAAGARAGLDAVQRVGEAQVGDRTLVDALVPAVEAFTSGGFADAASAATAGADRTAELRARMGRASYVGERAKGEPDPGAVGIALFFWAAATVAEPSADVRSPVRTALDDRFSFSDSIVVEATPQAVYDVVSDVTRTGQWSPTCVGCEWDDSDGPRVGAHFTGHNRKPDREWSTTSEVVAADPGRAFAWEVNGGLVRWGYEIAPDGTGTRLRETWEFREAGREFFHQRYGARADDEIAIRVADARSGIPATLAAIKRVVEVGDRSPSTS
ncbi:MAG: DAK2 domain-containing protein [Pseudonocardia sp.]|nr:DAK2 domain-containing protein [Pseudonocardia sp.]